LASAGETLPVGNIHKKDSKTTSNFD